MTTEACDKVLALIRVHPEGITVGGLIRKYELANRSTVGDCINRLEEQRKIRVTESQVSTDDHYDGVTVYPL